MKVYDTTPEPHALLGLANQKWHAQGAISELVDNSLGRLRGNAKNVRIIYTRRRGYLPQVTILDDGVGMDHIGRLFRLGSTIGMGPGDIGKYGMGGTLALLWLGQTVEIWTLRDAEVMHDRIHWNDYLSATSFPAVSDEWQPASLANTPVELFELRHGTMIRLVLREGRALNPDLVQRELADTYGPGLRQGREIRWFSIIGNRDSVTTLRGEPFRLPTDPKKIARFNLVVNIDGHKLPVKGTVALVDDLPYSQSVISIGFGCRRIFKTRDCYESADREKRYTGTGVAGWLDLGEGWQDYLSTTKDEISDVRVRQLLMQHVFEKIEPFLKQTETDQLSVVLEGIAAEMTAAFRGLGNPNFKIDVMVGGETPAENLRDSSTNPIIGDPADVAITPKVVEDANRRNHPDKPLKETPASTINLIRSGEAAMEGALCRLKIMSESENNFSVEVNEQHSIVQEVLKARPINKIALYLMVTREIAAEVIKFPGMMKRLLSNKIVSTLESSPDEARERLLARLLLDSARLPKIDEAA